MPISANAGQQIAINSTACLGEVEEPKPRAAGWPKRSNLINIDHPEWGVVPRALASLDAAAEVYMGCMAQQGLSEGTGATVIRS